MRRLAEDGIGSQVHYIPVHRQPITPRAILSSPFAGGGRLLRALPVAAAVRGDDRRRRRASPPPSPPPSPADARRRNVQQQKRQRLPGGPAAAVARKAAESARYPWNSERMIWGAELAIETACAPIAALSARPATWRFHRHVGIDEVADAGHRVGGVCRRRRDGRRPSCRPNRAGRAGVDVPEGWR